MFLTFLKAYKKLAHALRLGQGIKHVRGDQVEVLELYRFHGALHHITCNVQIHVSAEVGKVQLPSSMAWVYYIETPRNT